MKIWVIYQGDHEDYDVERMFLNESDARRYYETKMRQVPQPYELHEPEETEVSESLGEPREYIDIYALIAPEGSLVQEKIEYHFPDEYERSERESDIQVTWGGGLGEIRDPRIRFWIKGYDVERCRKITSEKCAQLVAEFDILIEKERLKHVGRLSGS